MTDQQKRNRAINNATTWNMLIWESDLPRHCKLVACYLRTHMNDWRETAWPSIARIAKYCDYGETKVREALRILCKNGYLLDTGKASQYGTKVYAIICPSETEPPQKLMDPPSETEPELNKELTNTLSKRFKPPKVDEVADYCKERGNTIDPQHFVDYQDARGWMLGKQKMKCWKATIRTWEKREKSNGQTQQANRAAAGRNQDTRRLSPGERTRQLREQRRREQSAP